jgi:GNAT superfamily N-acetyltransferase
VTSTRRATTLTAKPSALRLIWADVQAARSLGNHRPVQMETRRGTRFDLNRASEVLGEAFADYPWTRWTVDPEDHVRRVTALQRLALQHYGLPFGHVWVCAVDGVVHSVAVWMDSAVDVPSTVDEELLPLVIALEGSRHDASLAAERDVHDWRPDRRHYYLGAIGTTPARQGRGLGRAALTPTLRLADDEGVCAYLETSSAANVAFYSKLGFEVADHRRISGGGPEVWAMLRQPHAG